MIIDHVVFAVTNVEKSKNFYLQALAPIGLEVVTEGEGYVGLGVQGKPELWLKQNEEGQRPMHIGFLGHSREQVDEFYKLALEAGGIDNGAPGIRQDYHKDYYGAFVIDSEGHNIELVCHQPE